MKRYGSNVFGFSPKFCLVISALVLAQVALAQYQATVLQANSEGFGGHEFLQGGNVNGNAWQWRGALNGTSLHPGTGFSSSSVRAVREGSKAGFAKTTSGSIHAMLWNPNNVFTDLHPGPLFYHSSLTSLDGCLKGGTAIPIFNNYHQYGHAALWDHNNQLIDLHPLQLGATHDSAVQGMDSGRQVGFFRKPYQSSTSHQAVVWSGTASSAINLHPSLGSNYLSSSAFGVDAANIVGSAYYSPTGKFHAILWRNVAWNIHAFIGVNYQSSAAASVKGDLIVGVATPQNSGGSHAMLWKFNGFSTTSVDLHSFLPGGYVSSTARNIDEGANVMGDATDSTGQKHAVVWRFTGAPNGWGAKAGMGSGMVGRFRGGAFTIADPLSVGTSLFVFNGLDISSFARNDCWEWSSYTNAWSARANVPGAGRISPSGFSISNVGFVFGGLTSSGVFLNDLWKYDRPTDTWIQMASLPASGRHTSGVFVIGCEAYLVAGWGASGFLNEVWRWNSHTNAWTQVASLPGVPRRYALAFAIQGKGYAGLGSDAFPLQDFYEYDPNVGPLGTWVAKTGNSGVTTGIYKSGYALGQYGYAFDKNQLWRFDPSGAGSWTSLGLYPGVPRTQEVAASHLRSGFISTGKDPGVGSYYKDLWVWNP